MGASRDGESEIRTTVRGRWNGITAPILRSKQGRARGDRCSGRSGLRARTTPRGGTGYAAIRSRRAVALPGGSARPSGRFMASSRCADLSGDGVRRSKRVAHRRASCGSRAPGREIRSRGRSPSPRGGRYCPDGRPCASGPAPPVSQPPSRAGRAVASYKFHVPHLLPVRSTQLNWMGAITGARPTCCPDWYCAGPAAVEGAPSAAGPCRESGHGSLQARDRYYGFPLC